MKSNELISIIIPAYNAERNLTRCIDSIISQTYRNIEIIIVNDGSTDRTRELCEEAKKTDERIVIINKENGGQSSARNRGLRDANGSYICFVDSDDYVSNEMIEKLYNLQKEYDADVVEIAYTITKGSKGMKLSKERIDVYTGHNSILYNYLMNGMKKYNSYPVWTKMYRKNCIAENSFCEDVIYEDILFNFQVLKSISKYVVSNQVMYFYCVNQGSTTRSKFGIKNMDAIDVGRKIRNYTENSGDYMLIQAGRVTLARRYFMCLCTMIKYGVDDNIDAKFFVYESIDNLRKNYKLLMKTKMALSRKIILSMIVLNKRAILLLL